MAFEGMDIEAVSSLAGQLDTQANQIQSTIIAIDGIINSMEGSWKGPDAVEFQGWWQSQHRPHLHAAETAISGLAVSARNNVSAQQAASAH
jgi:uncharacterized protein YukE